MASRVCWGRALLLAFVLQLPTAATRAEPYTPQGVERKAILDTLREPVSQQLQQAVEFVVSRIVVSGNWAFVIATPQRFGGGPIAWQRTVCKGHVSHLVGGLMQRQGSGWFMQALALCPTDVAWVTWPQEHGAPAELFR